MVLRYNKHTRKVTPPPEKETVGVYVQRSPYTFPVPLGHSSSSPGGFPLPRTRSTHRSPRGGPATCPVPSPHSHFLRKEAGAPKLQGPSLVLSAPAPLFWRHPPWPLHCHLLTGLASPPLPEVPFDQNPQFQCFLSFYTIYQLSVQMWIISPEPHALLLPPHRALRSLYKYSHLHGFVVL